MPIHDLLTAYAASVHDIDLRRQTADDVLTELLTVFTADELADVVEAKREGRLVIVKIPIGAKIHDIYADYDFSVKEIDIYPNTAVYRCGNDGTGDYAAFSEKEYGKSFVAAKAMLAAQEAADV